MVANKRMLGRVDRLGGEDPREQISVIWAQVLEHLPKIERAVHRAVTDDRIDEDDLLGDVLEDLVSHAKQWDPKRGAWMAWARQRIRKCRTYHLRTIVKEQRRDRATLRTGAAESEEESSVELTVGVGERGSAARCEALAEVQREYDRSGPLRREVILAELHGLKTKNLLGLNSADADRRLREVQ